MDHKKWNFRMTNKLGTSSYRRIVVFLTVSSNAVVCLEFTKELGWCDGNVMNKNEKGELVQETEKAWKSCIVMLKSGVDNDQVMTHMVYNLDKETLLKEIREHVARNMAEAPDDALYGSETL